MMAEPKHDPKNQKTKRPWWHYLIGAIVTLISVGIMVRLVAGNLDTLLESWDQLNFWPLLGTIPLFILGEALASIAWGLLMNGIAPPLPMAQHFRIFVVTHAARRLPGTLWYVIGRVTWYERLGVPKRLSTFASILETIMIIWAGLIMALVTLPLIVNLQKNLWILLLLGIILSGLLMHPRVLGYLLKKLGSAEDASNLSYRNILTWLCFYFVLWLVGGSMLYLILRAFLPVGTEIWAICIGAWSIAGVSGLLIQILPSGLGLSEATLSLILSAYVPSSIAVSAAILLRILMTFYEFFVAIVVYWLSDRVTLFRQPEQGQR
jgi:uncharacterized membrane protein YbhN (UPF0104 family)